MLYGHTRPQNITWALAGPNSPAFETDVRLDNSQPSEQTAISGMSSGSPVITEYVAIQADWAAPQPIGAIGILAVSCPVGTRVVVTGKRPDSGGFGVALGGNSDSVIAALPDGRRQLIVVPTSTEDDFVGVEVRIYNDVGGAAWADGDTDLFVGEIGVFAAATIRKLDARRETGRTARRLKERAVSGAVHLARRGEYRSLSLTIHGTVAEAHTGGLDGLDWDTLRVMQDTPLYRALVIPRIHGEGGAVDYELCNRTALFSVVEWGNTSHSVGQNVQCSLSVEEAP